MMQWENKNKQKNNDCTKLWLFCNDHRHKQTYLLLDLLHKREAAFSSNVRRVGSMAELVQILNHCPGPQRNNKNHFFHRFLFAN
jgi:hypothetical protein